MNWAKQALTRQQACQDLSEEIQSYLEEKTAALMIGGMSRAEAEQVARREFGNVTLLEERSREEWQWPLVESIFADIKFATAQLRKYPISTILCIVTLALGIGANTTMATIIDTVLFRPLPYHHPSQLISIGDFSPKGTLQSESWITYGQLKARTISLDQVAAYVQDVAVIEGPRDTSSIAALKVTVNMLNTLEISPLLGRAFRSDEFQAGSAPVAMLSNQLWMNLFNKDRAIIGSQVKLGGSPHTIVGIMPDNIDLPGFNQAMPIGVWLPLQPTQTMLLDPGLTNLALLGRLNPKSSLAAAQAELRLTSRGLQEVGGEQPHLIATPLQDVLTHTTRPALVSLSLSVLLILVIACANVSNLQLVKFLSRRHEFALRTALGATRNRLLRQIVTEITALCCSGAFVGILLAASMLFAVRQLPPTLIPRINEVHLHFSLFLALLFFTACAALLSSAPVLSVIVHAQPQEALREQARGSTASRLRTRLSGFLVVSEIALAAMLLVAAGLIFRTFYNLQHVRLGFNTDQLVSLSIVPNNSTGIIMANRNISESAAGRALPAQFIAALLDRIRALPGIKAVSFSNSAPLTGFSMQSSFTIPDQSPGKTLNADLLVVSEDYTNALGIPVFGGRLFSKSDSYSSQPVALINEAFAHRFFPDKNPLGQTIDFGREAAMMPAYSIVGIIGDSVQHRLNETAQPQILLSYQQIPTTSPYYAILLNTQLDFLIKGTPDIPLESPVMALLKQLPYGYSLNSFESMRQILYKSNDEPRLGLYLISSFAGIAIAMVLVGLYGVMSHMVVERYRDIGIRVALGATPQSILYMIANRGAVLVITGAVSGLAFASLAATLVHGFLFGVQSFDPGTYFGVFFLLAVVGISTTLPAAIRGSRITPMEALRLE